MSQPPQDPPGPSWGPPDPQPEQQAHPHAHGSTAHPASGQGGYGRGDEQPAGGPERSAGGYAVPSAPQGSYGPPDPYGQQPGGGYAGQQGSGYAGGYGGQPGGGYGAPYAGVPAGQHGQPGQHGQHGQHGTPASTIVLLVLSGLGFVLLGLVAVGLPYAAPAALAIVALVRARTDPAGTRRLTRIGWIVFGVLSALLVVAAAVVIGLVAAHAGSSSAYDDGPTV